MTDHINQKFNANVLGFLREKNFSPMHFTTKIYIN